MGVIALPFRRHCQRAPSSSCHQLWAVLSQEAPAPSRQCRPSYQHPRLLGWWCRGWLVAWPHCKLVTELSLSSLSPESSKPCYWLSLFLILEKGLTAKSHSDLLRGNGSTMVRAGWGLPRPKSPDTNPFSGVVGQPQGQGALRGIGIEPSG